ncbi:hypothetical protein BDW69DRAFT_177496 [Aspergillus filifer]
MATIQVLPVNLDLPKAEVLLQRPLLDSSVLLHVECTGSDRSISLLSRLIGCTGLYSIRVQATYQTTDACRRLTQLLKQVLLSCRNPNLLELALDISPPRSGCVPPEPPSDYCGLGFTNDERPPSLRSLEIIAYPWGREPNHESSINFHAIEHPAKGEEVDYWAEKFDWSKLCRLFDCSSDLAFRIVPKLTALEEITFSRMHHPESIRSFLLTVPTMLLAISIPTVSNVGVDSILRHKHTLRKLEIHHPDVLYKLQEHEIRQMRDSLLKLEELTVDLGRSGADWPCSLLDSLASFPSLRKLDVYFDLGRSDDIARPYLTASTAMQLWKYMRDRSATLERVHLYSGCPSETGHGYPTDEVLWKADNTTSFICEAVSEAQQEQELQVTCPKLDDRLNNELRAACLSGAEKTIRLPDGHQVAFKVALEGPLPMEEWVTRHRQDEAHALRTSRSVAPKQRWTGLVRRVLSRFKPAE